MSYASDDDIKLAAGGQSRLIELADWNDDGQVDADVIARAKAAADGVLDGHLRLRLSAAYLEALRANPTPTISELAAAEVIYWLKKSKDMISADDVELRKERERQLDLMRDGQFRPADEPRAQRAVIVENEGEVSRKKTRGMW